MFQMKSHHPSSFASLLKENATATKGKIAYLSEGFLCVQKQNHAQCDLVGKIRKPSIIADMFSIRDNAFLEVSAQLQINPTVEVNPLILQQLLSSMIYTNINCRFHKILLTVL